MSRRAQKKKISGARRKIQKRFLKSFEIKKNVGKILEPEKIIEKILELKVLKKGSKKKFRKILEKCYCLNSEKILQQEN